MDYKEYNARINAHRAAARELNRLARDYDAAVIDVETLERYVGVGHEQTRRALEAADEHLQELRRQLQSTAASETVAWTDDGRYHEPKSFHPHGCAGCTSDTTKHGKRIKR